MSCVTTYFISHGSTLQLCPEYVGHHDVLSKFWTTLPQFLNVPKAILAISAHWETSVPTVSSMATQDTIYDFGGVPSRLYKIKYNCPGSPVVAQRVVELLTAAGIEGARVDPKRGLDHGSWVPMIFIYPNKDVPVLQLSLRRGGNPAYHYALGQALAPLKEEGVVIMGLGNATHNLRELNFSHQGPPQTWAGEFDQWLHSTLLSKRHGDVIRYLEVAPHARRAHPTPEHFLPLIVAMGAAGKDFDTVLLHHSWFAGSLSYSSFAFRPAGNGTSQPSESKSSKSSKCLTDW